MFSVGDEMKRYLLVLIAITLTGGLAHAQGGPSEADLKLAKQHHQLGTTYYDQGAYDKALQAFKESYELSRKPELLYNIAKCHESLGHLEEAIAHYRRYLSETGKEDATIGARIRNLEARLEKQKAPPPPATQPATQPAAVTSPEKPKPAEPAPPPEQGTSWKTIAGWSLVGLGVAALGAGIAMGAVSGAKATEVEDAYRAGNLDWADLKDVEASGQGLEVGMIVGVCVGAAAAVGGAALLLLSRGGGERRASVSPLLGRDVVGLTGSVSF
jgi:tetratricopeptide (TPR) repeat protein